MRKESKIVILFLLLFLFICQSCESNRNEVTIGCILPLTGIAAEFGVDNKNGITLALNDLNEMRFLQNETFNAIFEDSKNDPKMAASAFRRLLMQRGIAAYFISMSGISMALKPLIEENKIPALCVASATGLTQGSNYIFRLLPTVDYQAEQLANLIASIPEMKNTNGSLLIINDDFGNSFQQAFIITASTLGLPPSYVCQFDKNSYNFREIIAKSMEKRPFYFVIAGYGSSLGTLIKQLREYGFNGPIYGTPEMAYPEVLKIVGGDLGEAYVIDFNIDYDDSSVKKFINEYKNKFGREPSMDSFIGYDGSLIFAHAYKTYKSLKLKSLRDGLLHVKDLKGLTGKLSVREDGNIEFSLYVKKLDNFKAAK